MKSASQNVYELFIESCKKNLDRSAIFIKERTYSYQEFLSIASAIKKQIQSKKDFSKMIGIYTHESVNTYAAMWSIVSLGGAYVPINKKFPAERAKGMIEDAGLNVLLYSEDGPEIEELKALLKGKVEFIKMETVTNGELDFSYNENITGDDYIYLLFTSGSTGKPKGVPIRHKNLVSLIDGHLYDPKYNVNKDDRYLQMFELTFDVSVLSYVFPLVMGACFYVVPQDGIMYMEVLKILEDQKITIAYMVPSVINYLQPYFDQIQLPDLKCCMFAGEALFEKPLVDWQKCTPNGFVGNAYGPTEATVIVTEYVWDNAISPEETYNGIVPIGHMLGETIGYIVNDKDQEVPQGDKGELLLIGPQVTTHYWNDEEKSAKSFVTIQYKGQERNAYRTGDLCYLNERGNIMYCGRIDHQVQVNGYRVELGEIEFHSKKFLGNEKNLVAFPIKNTMGSTAVYMAIEGFDKTQEEALVSYLRKNLPVYMIPEKIIAVDALPLTISGKTDRGKLSTVYQPNN